MLGGKLRSSVVSGGLRHGTIDGLTTIEMHQGREPELAYARVSAQACWRHGRSTRCTPCSTRQAVGRLGRCWQPVARPRLLASHRCWSDAGRRSARLPRSFTGRATYHDDVTAALGIPPKDNGHELALIRSGRAPGSFTVSQRSARAAGREAKPPQSQSSN